MHFQIDVHREELKKKIDDIALDMIRNTEIYEKIYLTSLKEKVKGNFSSSFDESKSLANELNQIEDTFRSPNLLNETIKEMQQKLEGSLNEIQIKLKEINQVKDNLNKTNEFRPNLTLLNQEKEASVFGSIKLDDYWPNFLKSEILTNQQQYVELIKLCEFSPNDKWSLLYRGTRDGFGAFNFHSKCDNHSNTLTILKAHGTSYIFGGFVSIDWDRSSGFKSDPNAFLFSLINKDNMPLKMKIDPNEHHYAIYCNPEFGPTFGDDINIINNPNTTMCNYSNLNHTYSHPRYGLYTNEAQAFLSGAYNFQLDEIEVYQRE
jgi:hypothetical protein